MKQANISTIRIKAGADKVAFAHEPPHDGCVGLPVRDATIVLMLNIEV